MPPVESPPTTAGLRQTIAWILAGVLMLGAMLFAVVWLLTPYSGSVGPDTPVAGTPGSTASRPAFAQPGPQWHELSAAHQATLKPLASLWNGLGLHHKSKWIALAKAFPNRTEDEQARLQERMVQWAALTPKEREVARLNFAETKKLPASDLAAKWAAYQELSPEEKSRLASKAADKSTTATIAIAPTPNDRITAVPITRRTNQFPENAAITRPQLDPNTLLPKLVIPPTASDAPAVNTTPASTPAVSSDTLSPN